MEEEFSPNNKVTPSMFNRFWNVYPLQLNKAKAERAWQELCKQELRPTWREIKRAIIAQKKSDLWQNPRYIKHPVNWIKERYWEQDALQMIDFKMQSQSKPPIYDDGTKYVWNPKRECYVHPVSGIKFIP